MRQAVAVLLHTIVDKVQDHERQQAADRLPPTMSQPPTTSSSASSSKIKGEVFVRHDNIDDEALHADLSSAASSSSETRPPSAKVETLVRLLSLVSAFSALWLFAAAIHYINKAYTNVRGGGDWTDGFALVAPLLSLFLDPLVVARNVLKHRTTHHAVRIGISALIFALALPALVTALLGSLYHYWGPALQSLDGTTDCTNPLNAFSYECAPIAHRIGQCQIAGSVFLAIVATCHLGLAVRSVADLTLRRRAERTRRLTRAFDMQLPPAVAVDSKV